MKIIIKSLILAVAAINSAVLLPMTVSEQQNAAAHEQEQEQQMTFYWKVQDGQKVSLLELGRIPAHVVAEISSVIKHQMGDRQFNQEERYQLIFSEKEDDKETIELFIKLLQSKLQNQGSAAQQAASGGVSQQITAPGTSAYHASLSTAPVQKLQLTAAELVAQNQHLIIDLISILERFEIFCFNEDVSNILEPMLENSCGERVCPLKDEALLLAAKFIASNSPYDHIVIQDPVLEERGRRPRISPNCQLAAIVSQNAVRVVDLMTKQTVRTIVHNDLVWSAAFSPDSKYVVTASEDKTAKIVEVSSGQERVIRHNSVVNSAAFSPDGKYVVTVSHDNTVKVVEVSSGNERTINHGGSVSSAAFSPDGKYVVTRSLDHTAKVVEVLSGNERTINHGGSVDSAAFSPDGKYVVTASDDKTAKIVEVSSGQERVIRHNDWVRSAAFSPDGKYVVTASYDKTAKISEVPSGKEIAVIRHDGVVYSAAFSPDGKYVVTVSYKTAKIVEVLSNQVIATIRLRGYVYSAEFSPDGKYVVTASCDTVRVIPLGLDGMEPDKILAIAVLVRMALNARKNGQQPTVQLDENSWILKTFMTLSVQERNRLQEQFPEVRSMITNTVQERAFEQNQSSRGWSSMLARYCTIL